MTANQIAAEGNRIQREVAQRQQDEINRHNKAVEDIQSEQNRLTAEANDIQQEWNKFQMHWKTEYEDKYRQWELSNEDEKILIQWELQQLEERKVLTDEDYKRRMATTNELLAAEEMKRTELTKEFQEFQKSAKWAELGLTERDLAIQQKRIEYEHADRHEENLIRNRANEINARSNQIAENFNIARMDYQWANLNWEREKLNKMISRDYGVATYQFDIQKLNYDLAKKRYEEIDKKLSNAQAFQSYAGGLFGKSGVIPGTFEIVTNIVPFIGGLNGTTTKTSKQIFDSLFTN